eukprot:CAMPEP_0172329996 /NCGR_PEP_ID=MMETSP1058-20130122/61171_1 /TAXON_ID=83371 /ORGANISM="Detonula confervacea, Strain CCMP 353" /LENGTH=66 /DNA_ID=CAMNT_0013047191 /DNA_START=817 /DNA_END=1017 /DNA_ORIENTATION=+
MANDPPVLPTVMDLAPAPFDLVHAANSNTCSMPIDDSNFSGDVFDSLAWVTNPIMVMVFSYNANSI